MGEKKIQHGPPDAGARPNLDRRADKRILKKFRTAACLQICRKFQFWLIPENNNKRLTRRHIRIFRAHSTLTAAYVTSPNILSE